MLRAILLEYRFPLFMVGALACLVLFSMCSRAAEEEAARWFVFKEKYNCKIIDEDPMWLLPVWNGYVPTMVPMPARSLWSCDDGSEHWRDKV